VSVLQRVFKGRTNGRKIGSNSRGAAAEAGRPSKEEATRRALAAILIDPRTVDPLAVLAGIMMDATLPASARVQAARALLAARDQDPQVSDAHRAGGDAVSVRAQQLLAARRRAN
jgi:hypothetical protein